MLRRLKRQNLFWGLRFGDCDGPHATSGDCRGERRGVVGKLSRGTPGDIWSLTVQNGESRVDADPTEPPTNVAATLMEWSSHHSKNNNAPGEHLRWAPLRMSRRPSHIDATTGRHLKRTFFFAHKPFKLTREKVATILFFLLFLYC